MNAKALALVASLLAANVAFGEMSYVPMPAENRLVVFPYDPHDSYTILTIPGAITHLELAPNEEVQAFALGDAVQWKAERVKNNLFIRPSRPGLFTSATLVTNLRTYQITLRSGPIGGKWFQRVTWSYPDMVVMSTPDAPVVLPSKEEKKEQEEAKARVASGMVPVENLSFDYDVQGESPFRPLQVFDDGTFTYIRLSPNVRQMPALFVSVDGRNELVNYSVNDYTLKVQGLFTQAVLKLGSEEVQVTNRKGRATGSWIGAKLKNIFPFGSN